MFKIQEDRCDYGRLLTPPCGYELDMAVGTTYSLDLEALTLSTISMGLGEETDTMMNDNPICLLNALRKVTEKIVLFHEAGHILIPANKKNSRLYQLLEKMVVPVALPQRNGYIPAFHPKCWLIAYKQINGRDKLFRFIVMSRNLTFDRSWDISVALEGEPQSQRDSHSEPISYFMRFLSRQISLEDENGERLRKIANTLADQVSNVHFSLGESKLSDFEVLPLGIGKNRYDIDADKWLGKDGNTFHDLVIMSPFVSPSVIKRFNDRYDLTNCRRTLIARRAELSKLSEESAGKFDLWALKNDIVEGETALSDEDPIKLEQDIHAKIFCVSKNGGKDAGTSLYLGSMNATEGAFHHNVELNIRFDGSHRHIGPEQFLYEIFGSDVLSAKNPFEQIELDSLSPAEEAKENAGAELLLKRFCRIGCKAEVTKEADGKYSIKVFVPDATAFVGFSISPISINAPRPMANVTIFPDMELLQLSEFYRIVINLSDGEKLERIVKIPTKGIPAERDQQIFSSFIDRKEKFYEYLAFILSDDKLQTALGMSAIAGETGEGSRFQSRMPALYESMLEASLHHPEKFIEIRRLMEMLPDDNTAKQDFSLLFEMFEKTIKR